MDKWFNNNNFAKILALAVSLLLWFMIHLDEVPTTPTIATGSTSRIVERTVPVQPYGLDSNSYVLTSLSTDEVRLEIKGQRSMLTSIFTNDDYKVLVDLSEVKDGSNTLPLVPDLPSGVEVVSMEPSMVTVNVEKLGTKSFNVNIVPEGEPSAGYTAGTPVVEPSGAVKVTLPEGQLEAVAKVQGSVSVKDAKDDITQKKVKLQAYDAEGKVIDNAVISPETVEVRVPVNQPYTSIPLRLKYSGQLPEGLVLSKVEPNVKEVSVYGTEEALAGIRSYDQLTLDLTQFEQAGESTVNLDLTPPPGFEKIEPSSIQLKVTVAPYDEKEETTKVFPNVPITLTGIGNGLESELVTPKSGGLNITLKGSSSMLEGLSSDDIKLSADLHGLAVGNHEVQVTADLPRFAELDETSNDLSATVKITENADETTVPPSEDATDEDTVGPEPSPAEVENGNTEPAPEEEETESNTETQEQTPQGNVPNRGNTNSNSNANSSGSNP
ncbi:CdaR family protein [Paenibacillus tundrae]|uniref:YbbR domain-containing protein n=1 Tax=Paenibacillus tundrae TaxID=528187 RepID=A0ABT9WKE9_9BACL|nr:CdaR family protein [Paenibacillus tundrae]MDQ0173660.1 YbbR domain-containing protein [Paenibacillus tundrae]